MLQTVAQLLPFALAGAFLPTWTSHVIVLLGTERPVGTASAYVAGNAVWRLALGFTALFVVSVTAPESAGRGFELPVALTWNAAAVLAATGIGLIVRTPLARTSESRLSRWVRGLKRFPPWAAFGIGVYNCATPGVQWAYYLGGVRRDRLVGPLARVADRVAGRIRGRARGDARRAHRHLRPQT